MTPRSDASRSEQLAQQLDAQLRSASAKLLDPMDIPLSWTRRQLEDYETKRAVLVAQLQTVGLAQYALRKVEPKIATLTKWRDHLVAWQKELAAQLEAHPAEQALHPHEMAMREKLQLSLKRIRVGMDLRSPESECMYANLPLDDLMRDAGYVPRDLVARAEGDAWHGSLSYVEPMLSELIAQRDDAVVRLNKVEEALAAAVGT
jgi:hypothetical protein